MCAQLPVIRHGKNTVADSYFIIKYLERTYSENIPQLSAEQEALSVAIQHLVDDCLVRGLGYHRWIQPQVSELFSATLHSTVCVLACRDLLHPSPPTMVVVHVLSVRSAIWMTLSLHAFVPLLLFQAMWVFNVSSLSVNSLREIGPL